MEQPFNNWLDGAREDLVDMFIVHTMEEIQGLLDAHEQFKATLGEADKEYQSIIGLVRQVESIAKQHSTPGGVDNPYTSLTAQVFLLPPPYPPSSSLSTLLPYRGRIDPPSEAPFPRSGYVINLTVGFCFTFHFNSLID